MKWNPLLSKDAHLIRAAFFSRVADILIWGGMAIAIVSGVTSMWNKQFSVAMLNMFAGALSLAIYVTFDHLIVNLREKQRRYETLTKMAELAESAMRRDYLRGAEVTVESNLGDDFEDDGILKH